MIFYTQVTQLKRTYSLCKETLQLLQKANKNYYHIVIFYSIHGFVGLLLLTAALSVIFSLCCRLITERHNTVIE
jgi:hypothetical protein